jgi:hypothetical protein
LWEACVGEKKKQSFQEKETIEKEAKLRFSGFFRFIQKD